MDGGKKSLHFFNVKMKLISKSSGSFFKVGIIHIIEGRMMTQTKATFEK